MEREFKYYPEDFKPLPVKVEHMDLVFDVYDDHTDVVSDVKVTASEDLVELEMNAHNLDIKVVSASVDLDYEYKKDDKILLLKFKEEVKKGTEVRIHTESTCKPTSNILEGLYFDETPEGAPPQQITQCQQWGFQRIVPCFDDMSSKCTYKTKIIADSRYTHMITNGDIVQEKTDLGNGRSEIVYENMITPMATYLSFLGVGTWDAYQREFEYPDGHTFMLEFLAPVGANKDSVEKALDIIHYSAMWIYVFTGKDTYVDVEKRKALFSLIEERELQKKAGNDIEDLRTEIKSLAEGLNFGYKYTGTVYREIAMQNSNFGGMENVGNTTITANRIMPYKEMSDNVFAYMMEVKQHEFYHNLNGSEVTGWSPFEFWLNEAITCLVEADFLAFIAGPGKARLSNVQRIVGTSGTFGDDEGTMAMPIMPDGFNNPDELVSNVTYSKSPEFMRMVSLLMGKDKFAKALAAYHKKYSHSNAKAEDWINTMIEASGFDFRSMANGWLRKTGFPTVKVTTVYNDGACEIDLEQNGDWEFPFALALFDSEGKKLREELVHVKDKKTIVVIDDLPEEPSFYSFNRDLSFYGKVDYDVSNDKLYLQAEKDDDVIAKFLAFSKIADDEKTRLLKDSSAEVDERYVDLFFKLLSNENLTSELGTAHLATPGGVEDKKLTHYYEELYQTRKKIRMLMAKKYEKELKALYEECKHKRTVAPYVEQEFFNIKNRQVKNSCLSILSELDTSEIHAMIKEQFEKPICATDKMVAFTLYIGSSASDKSEVIDSYENFSKGNLVEWEQYLACIGMNDSDDAIDIIKRVMNSDKFRIEQANDHRALLVRFVFNKRKSFASKEGRAFTLEIMKTMAKLNEYGTGHMLSAFDKLDDEKEEYQAELVGILKGVLGVVSEQDEPSVYNTINRILKNSPEAVKKYEGS